MLALVSTTNVAVNIASVLNGAISTAVIVAMIAAANDNNLMRYAASLWRCFSTDSTTGKLPKGVFMMWDLCCCADKNSIAKTVIVVNKKRCILQKIRERTPVLAPEFAPAVILQSAL